MFDWNDQQISEHVRTVNRHAKAWTPNVCSTVRASVNGVVSSGRSLFGVHALACLFTDVTL